MTGIFLLFVVVLWLVIAYWLTKLITIKLPKNGWRILVRVLLFFVLLPLPLADEIVGKRQFEQLCKENSTFQFDRATAVGKTVYLTDIPDIQIKDTWVPVRLEQWRYVDAATGELIFSYNILHAKGGELIRMLGISGGDTPLTFKGYCAPGGSRIHAINLFKELGITVTKHPEENIGKIK